MTELPLIGDYSTPTTPLSGARIGVITFPGTLDDVDALRAVRLAGAEPVSLWHADADPQRTLAGVDAVVIPGGFSYGDYLRAGAIARFAPMMDAVATAAGGPEGDADGLPVLGICNGFQILCESGLLPGVLMRNVDRRFICHRQLLRVERADTRFTSAYAENQVIDVCVAHGEGNYFADPETLAIQAHSTNIGEILADDAETVAGRSLVDVLPAGFLAEITAIGGRVIFGTAIILAGIFLADRFGLLWADGAATLAIWLLPRANGGAACRCGPAPSAARSWRSRSAGSSMAWRSSTRARAD